VKISTEVVKGDREPTNDCGKRPQVSLKIQIHKNESENDEKVLLNF
jgi:hypothetical protein